MAIKAVITGDLIGSTAKGQEAIEASMAVIAEVAQTLSGLAGADTRFTRYRGDGWQIYLDFPGLCLRAVLLIAAGLRASGTGLATRQSIGLGRVGQPPPANLSLAYGQAFEVSGTGLDQMEGRRRLHIGGRGIVSNMHETIVAFADWQSARWSREQAEAIGIMFSDRNTNFVTGAKRLGITRQAFQARLQSAGLEPWQEALYAFESGEWFDHDET